MSSLFPPMAADKAANRYDPAASEGRPSVRQLVVPYWRSERRWYAFALLAVILTIMFSGTYLAVWANKLVGEVTDALVNRRWDALLTSMLWSVGVGVLSTAIIILNTAVQDLLELDWRTWMTDKFLARWTESHVYFDVELEGVLDNSDQRISEDLRLFVNQTLNLSLSTTSVIVHCLTFGVLLWQLSGVLHFELWGTSLTIPGFLVCIAVLQIGLQFLLVHWVGKPMVGLNNRKQTVEADYRYLAMQLRENAEQVAFYGGGEREHGRLWSRFTHVRRNVLAMVVRTVKMKMTENVYGKFLDPVSTVASLPRYLAGEITLGGLTRSVDAFKAFTSSLSFFVQAYSGFAAWLAISNRLRDMAWALARAQNQPAGVRVQHGDAAVLTSGHLTLCTPMREPLLSLPPQRFEKGQRWMLRGPSGVGKSTLLRAIAGLWPHGDGEITLPKSASMMFLPQRSYIPAGTLKEALAYPADPTGFADEACHAALLAVGLAERTPSLTTNERWQQILSGGEQQRLAMARALLHRPDFLFLDEATSALDEDGEAMVYEALLTQLPDSAVISIAHRSTLVKYHDQILELHKAAA
jgi:putative ATP-binding cassette transporter